MFAMLIFRLERVELQALRAPLRFLKFSSKEVVQMETKYSQNKLFWSNFRILGCWEEHC
jgi:hypothetical protein